MKSRRRNAARGALLSAFVLTLAGLAWPHDTWLLARQGDAAVGATVPLDLTSGMAFPRLEYAILAERVERASMRLGGQTSDLRQRLAVARSLRFSATMERAGVASVAVSLRPKTLELTPSKVAEYLTEIGASPEIRQAWAEMKPKRWRESYAKHAKTFVRVGDGAGDASWAEPMGLALEIVPEKDPTRVRVGESLSVRVLKQGRPLPGFPVGFVREGEAHGSLQKTDADGRTTFKPRQAGRWLLRGTDLRRASAPDRDWESDFTTLTLRVLPAR